MISSALALLALWQDWPVGARGMGLGGATTCIDEDPVALRLNPAGVAGAPLRAEIDYQTFTKHRMVDSAAGFDAADDPRARNPEVHRLPGFLGLTIPLGGGLQHTLGVATYKLSEFDLTQTKGGSTLETEQSILVFRAAYAVRWHAPGEPEFLRTVAAGVALDGAACFYNATDNATKDRNETDTQPGLAAGLLVGVYGNGRDLAVDVGAAYQRAPDFDPERDPFGAFVYPFMDWPSVINVGLTVKALDRLDLRVVADVQIVRWKAAAGDFDVIGGSMRDATNVALGVEYFVRLGASWSLMPRAGLSRVETPWGDDLSFVALGATVQLAGETKVHSLDLAVQFGDEDPNYALGYRLDF
jgi:hypothetical protein